MRATYDTQASLKREYLLYTSAINFYKTALRKFEQKHHLTTRAFLKRFESGRLGDDAEYFDWYAFAMLLAQWQQAQSAIKAAVR
jgi:hypothetical protein